MIEAKRDEKWFDTWYVSDDQDVLCIVGRGEDTANMEALKQRAEWIADSLRKNEGAKP